MIYIASTYLLVTKDTLRLRCDTWTFDVNHNTPQLRVKPADRTLVEPRPRMPRAQVPHFPRRCGTAKVTWPQPGVRRTSLSTLVVSLYIVSTY